MNSILKRYDNITKYSWTYEVDSVDPAIAAEVAERKARKAWGLYADAVSVDFRSWEPMGDCSRLSMDVLLYTNDASKHHTQPPKRQSIDSGLIRFLNLPVAKPVLETRVDEVQRQRQNLPSTTRESIRRTQLGLKS